MYAEKIMELNQQLLALRIADWHDKVISWQWFLLLVLLLLPWYLWWKIVDRREVIEIFAYGLVVSIISALFNGNFLNLGLFSYPYPLIPINGRAYAFSLSVLPVIYMLVYQYFKSWKSFAMASVALSALIAFMAQPLLAWMDMYKLIKWNYFYSFLVLLVISLGARLINQLVLSRSVKRGIY